MEIKNKDYFKELKKILNEFKRDKGNMSLLLDSFKKYGKDDKTIFNFDETADYEKIFLNIYYDTCRLVGIMEETSAECQADPVVENLMYNFIGFLMINDLYEKYGTESLDEKEYEKYISEFNLK